MIALQPVVDFAWTQGPVFWLLVAAGLLAAEAISGKGWWLWGAAGGAVAAGLTLWLNLEVWIEAVAFVAATVLGLVYSLQMRFAAARKRKAQRSA